MSDRASDAALGRSVTVPIMLVLMATLCFAGSDVLTKRLTASVPSLEAAWLRYASFTTILFAYIAATGRLGSLHTERRGWQVARGLALAASTLIYATGLMYLPVAVAAATNFVSPVFIAALAAWMLRERIGPQRGACAILGLVGVLIVMRPGTDAFNPATILPLLAALCFAYGNVLTRLLVPFDDALTILSHTAVVGLAALTLPLPLLWVAPSPADLAVGFGIGALSTGGHSLVVQASRFAESSVLAPFLYLQIVATTVLGYLVFGSVPDVWTALGSAVIIGSGISSFLGERLR